MHMSGAVSFKGTMIGWKSDNGVDFKFDVPKGVRLSSVDRQFMLFVVQGDYKAGERLLLDGYKTTLPN
jgi:hypothetical protein